jgi:NADH-quinone oxidoreductase subunit L
VNGVAAILTVVVPTVFAAAGILTAGRSPAWAREWARTGAFGALAAALVEAVVVLGQVPIATTAGQRTDRAVAFLGQVDLGVAQVRLDLRSDALSALVAVAVAIVALCVQVYSPDYLDETGQQAGRDQAVGSDHQATGPARYPAYAAEVSLFTAAMMLVVHADDLLLLVIGWEVMGICSYLLVGHHSERASARRAAVKAFLVTRVGDLGMLLAVAVLLTGTHTTSIRWLTEHADQIPSGTVTAATLLLLAAVAGKSAQFPLHTWLPDAMEGPTPVSALIHAATMVAAGAYLVARLLPLFVAAPVSLTVAAVMAAITMLGAALVALAQDDLKRLLAWSTISQVAYMLAGTVAAGMGHDHSPGPGVLHLLSHAAFKALLFLLAGCVIHLVGSTSMHDMGGLRHTNPWLATLFGVGLAALAGIPPLGGFWSKEGVLSAAEQATRDGAGWPAWVLFGSGLLTALVTGVYAARAYGLVVLGPVAPALAAAAAPNGYGVRCRLPAAMTWPLWVLAVPTALLGLVLVRPPALLSGVHVDALTAFTGSILSLAGVGWALSARQLGARDVADALPPGVRALLRDGLRIDALQERLVVRPVSALARVAAVADRDVVDAYVRGVARTAGWAGAGLRKAGTGLVTDYLAWVVAGSVVVGLAAVVEVMAR